MKAEKYVSLAGFVALIGVAIQTYRNKKKLDNIIITEEILSNANIK